MYAFAAGQVITMNVAGRIRFHGTINISNPTAWVEYVSFYVCVDECKLRSSCSAVNYHRFYNLCQLNLEPNPRVIPTNERGLLYWIKTAPESFCKISGGHLVYINDASENTFIKDKARQMTHWDIREPNGDGDCAHLMYQYDFQWNDISCTTQYQLYPICEK
ncbi:hypothetical protein MAR_034829 [Mya arenaria]|uniref:C-type lectin domain-containing protein n=1 Tax=Mya arenaria TaxID=6604 RepID=A0ABY7EID2_MYAAR|nr:hypothetical protein MAR_034829 [Mya arenaria]